jgi:lipopolysaccharide biosynthesis glycosyltransferase
MKKYLTIPKNNAFSVVFCDDVHTFVVIDKNYIETSLVCLYSFHRYNPEFNVTIYGVDFTEEDKSSYTQRLKDIDITTYNVESLSTADMHFDYKWNIFYSDIINIISAKFKIMEKIKEKYILYFDTDTIFTGSISSIFSYLEDKDLAGVRYNTARPEINCGIFLAKNKYLDYYSIYLNFFINNRLKFFNIDEVFLCDVYNNDIAYLPIKYNVHGDDANKPIKIEPLMIHYPGAVKPYEHKELSSFICSRPQAYAEEWYKVYYQIKKRLHPSKEYDTKVTETKKYLEKVLDNEVINPDKNFVDRIYNCKHLLGGDFLNSIVKYLVDQHNKISHNSEPK